MRAVFDTNIYVSAFVFPGGRAEEAFLLALDGHFTLCSSTAILAETAGILMNKFAWERESVSDLIEFLGQIARVAAVPHGLKILADEPDNRILECAEEANALYINTGDRHLLDLNKFQDTRVLTLSDFLALPDFPKKVGT
jgi:uncharacterized protein